LLMYIEINKGEASVEYVVSDDKITLIDLNGNCCSENTFSIYHWNMTLNTVSLRLIEVPCERRIHVLTDDAWFIDTSDP
jgi:hypothetical protein